MAISLFEASQAMEGFLILTYAQWLYIGLILFGLFLPQWLILWSSFQKKGPRLMAIQESLEQQDQARDNAELLKQIKEEKDTDHDSTGRNNNIDKKLDGPNLPAD